MPLLHATVIDKNHIFKNKPTAKPVTNNQNYETDTCY